MGNSAPQLQCLVSALITNQKCGKDFFNIRNKKYDLT